MERILDGIGEGYGGLRPSGGPFHPPRRGLHLHAGARFHAAFPLSEKLDVKGPGQSPVFAFLAGQSGEPKWNFTKYLVGKDGQVIQAFPSGVEPESPELRDAIEAALKG
jgi:glutathione peroxidase-family protein